VSKSSSSQKRKRARIAAGAAAGAVTLGLIAGAVALAVKPASSDVVIAAESYNAKHATVTPRPTVETIKIEADRLNPGTKVSIFGDSWTESLFLTPDQGYAQLAATKLKLEAEVLGGGGAGYGSGYLNPGNQGLGTFDARLAGVPVSDARLLIIQGSTNDLNQNLLKLGAAFDKTIETARKRFPKAQIVILGPSTATMPAPVSLGGADNVLSERAANAGLPYISPYQEHWIDESNFSEVINKKNSHPTAEGHAYLAKRLVESINKLKAK
jgi:lysophospholipase L1-like esterase